MAELSNYTQPHYFILPWSYEYFNNHFLDAIQKEFRNIIIFRDRAELAAYEEDGEVNILIITIDDANTFANLKLS